MPELPEVETTLRGIFPHVSGRQIVRCEIRNPRLRYLVPMSLPALLAGKTVDDLWRRGKYLLFEFAEGHMMVHLGMSGSLRLVAGDDAPGKHDHVEWLLSSGQVLRYTDPRRFGSVIWIEGKPLEHKLLKPLGPEPLSEQFTAAYLHKRAAKRTLPVKSFVMNSHVVVGVGNIYANEALFMAGIHPLLATGKMSKAGFERLVAAIKIILTRAIEKGGTTLQDFVGGDGKPGYFSQSLQVYGRGGKPCFQCGGSLDEVRLSQRATVYCPHCQARP